MTVLVVFLLSMAQNIAFTMVSRARNRSSGVYHIICSVVSNGIFFLTFHHLTIADFDIYLIIPFIIGTTLGSVIGARVSKKIETMLGATT